MSTSNSTLCHDCGADCQIVKSPSDPRPLANRGRTGLENRWFCRPCYVKRWTPPQLVTAQPAPTPNDKPAVWDLVVTDMQARDAEGRRKYGTPLQPFNGRDALVDAYQEALDLCVYLRTAIYERDGR